MKLNMFNVRTTKALSHDEALFGGYTVEDWADRIWMGHAAIFRVSRHSASRVFDTIGLIESLDIAGQSGWALLGKIRPTHEGSDYFLVRSSDGGNSWKELGPIALPALSQTVAVSESEAWLLGFQHLYHTVDGGKSWPEVSAPGTRNAAVEKLALVNGALLILCDGAVLATRDGGKSWARYTVPATGARVDAVFRDLVVSHLKGQIHLDVLDGKKEVILPGTSFASPALPFVVWGDPPAHIEILAASSGTELGFGTMLYASTDNGKTWKGSKIPCTAEAISLGPDGGGFALDPEQRVLISK